MDPLKQPSIRSALANVQTQPSSTIDALQSLAPIADADIDMIQRPFTPVDTAMDGPIEDSSSEEFPLQYSKRNSLNGFEVMEAIKALC
jgi:hypothetical protein